MPRPRRIRTNAADLLEVAAVGTVTSPYHTSKVYDITHDGRPVVLPGMGGICYNVRVGDSATRWVGDHCEPGASLSNLRKDAANDTSGNFGLNILACVGNRARVVGGPAEGGEGTVTGKHGGLEHVLVDFPPEVLERLRIGDPVQIRARGVGLELMDFPEVRVFNCDPRLPDAWGLEAGKGGTLRVPVAKVVPAKVMGSGLGRDTVVRGDYDIPLFDEKVVAEHGLADLRLGDLVAILDADHSYGRIYREGAVSVGVVVHGSSVVSGHGPGVTTLLTSSTGRIAPVRSPKANIASILAIR
jgi:hypothetical protein